MSTRSTTASMLAALALVGVASCAAPAAPGPGSAPAPASAPAEAGEAGGGGAALGQAVTAATALAALGGLGEAQGAGEQVRTLGGQLSTDAQALTDQLRAQAEATGATVQDSLTAEQQALLADLGARTGEPFDQAWLRAATDAIGQARDAANAVLASADATPEARAAAEDALSRLDALSGALSAASTDTGADTPQAVDAGSGGQAAEEGPLLAVGLLGAGAALLGGAAWRRRRTS